MANPQNLIPFTGADDPRRSNGRPKGSKNWSTIVKEILYDEQLYEEVLAKNRPDLEDLKRLGHKNAASAIAFAMAIKALEGNKDAAEWLRKTGYGDKIEYSVSSEPAPPDPYSFMSDDELRRIAKDEAVDEDVQLHAKIELARRHFYDFCQLLYPNAYSDDRKYLKDVCDRLEDFVLRSKKRYLVLSMPPRHLKSFTAQNLTKWLFGRDIFMKVMTASYNERLSTMFAKAVRNTIQMQKGDKGIVYSDIFPRTRIRHGEASAGMWSLEGNEEINYVATSPGGTATGIGSHFTIIDDPIKSAEEAYNENVLENIWEWFTNTMQQRTEGGNYKFIIIMTRWATGDLAGRVIDAYGDDVEVISYKAVQDDGSMLCESILSREDYENKIKEMNHDIAEANYNQTPIDIKGRLYSEFKEWEKLPAGSVINFTDTADTGEDYLCSIDGVIFENEFYVTNIVFTDEPMEVTEPMVAEMLHSDGATEANIESNNGGRGFARNIERLLRERYNSNKCAINSVPQTSNKESRILASATWVQNHVYMPPMWKQRFPKFYQHLMSYQRKGKNAHDDGPDVLAMIYEYMTEEQGIQFFDMGTGHDTRRDRVLTNL